MKQLFNNQLQELINTIRYDSREVVNQILPWIRMVISLLAVGSIVYYHGFPATPTSTRICISIIVFSLTFYVFKYFIYLIIDNHPRKYIREKRFEGVIILAVLFIGFLSLFFERSIVNMIQNRQQFSTLLNVLILIIQLYFLIIVVIEIGQASPLISNLDLTPSSLLTLSFLLLILSGTGVLMLPEMTISHSISFIDALFTSASASCVTGLIVVDTATYFTLKGQFIIMILIQLGGINIISFAAFFTTFYSNTGGVKYQSLLKDFLSSETISETRSLLRDIIFLSLTIELVGAFLIFMLWDPNVVFNGFMQKLFFSVFHSISALNNAGFSLFTNGLFEPGVSTSYGLHLVIAALIIIGGIGFFVIHDIRANFAFSKQKRAFTRLKVNSKVVLMATSLLLLLGTVLFFIYERDGVLRKLSVGDALITSFFQSVTARTAGFNTVDFSILSTPTLLVMMILMFIGASPGSTGGGIKTTTFAVIMKSAFDTIKGKRNVEFFRHSVSMNSINKAYSLTFFSLFLIFFSTLLLTYTEPSVSFDKLLFEEISAFATVGLSTGITPTLSVYGKIIITCSMFVGRIGTLTLVLSLSQDAIYKNYKYGKANIQIG